MTEILSPAGQTVLSVVLALIILLAMITIHEFGHYVVGRLLNFKINEFAIGFGPAIIKYVGKKSGRKFSVRAFPLGGFCAFDGEDGDAEEDPAQPFTELEGEKPRAEQKVEPKVEPKGKRFNEQAPWKRILVLIAGAAMNYLLALLLVIIGFFSFGQAVYKVNSVAVSEEYGLEYSLRDGDVITAVEGRTVYLAPDFIKALNGKKKGDTAGVTVLRDGAETQIEVKMRADCDFVNSSDTSKIWRALGAGTRQQSDALYWDISGVNVRFGFWQTLGRSFGYTFRLAGTILSVLGELLSGHLSISSMGGPVTTIKMTGEMAVMGFESFLQIAAYIGVNLAVFNLLPIPALDGSKVVFCLIEWIFRKPVPRKVEAVIHAVGLVLILGFAVLVDILQFARC